MQAQSDISNELSIRNQILQIFLDFPAEEMFDEVLKTLLDVFKSEYGVFGYVNEKGALVIPSMTRQIWDKCQVSDKKFIFPRDSWGDSIWPQAMRQKKTLYSNEPSTLIPQGHVQITRNISAPIVYNDESIGLIQVANKPTNYDEMDLHLIQVIVNFIAPVLKARLERDVQEKKRRQAEERLTLQAKEIMETATPVIQVIEGIIIAPIIGTLDSERTQQIMERILNQIVETHSSVAILDITGVPTIDTATAANLIETITAVKLLGAEVVVTGIRPSIAQTMVHLGIDLASFRTYSSLEHGIRKALKLIGLKLIKVE